jgi:hypothetical protein
MINNVSVGAVFVDGPGDHAISLSERIHVMASIQEGLEGLAANEPKANLSWTVSALNVKLNETPVPWEGAPWPGLTTPFYRRLDAALWVGHNNRIYFFRGSEYIRINPNNGWKADPGYPKQISDAWKGMPASFNNGINAALWSPTNNKVYLFKGSEYVRIDPTNNWNMDPGYPKQISAAWNGMPSDFASGVDSALWVGHNQRIYFFKGDKYVRVNPSGWKVDPGYPKNIKDAWKDMPEGGRIDFNKRIDAAVWTDTNNRVYFFHGDMVAGRYVRINPANSWKMDPGYPKLVGVGYEEAEKKWRDPALEKLGYPPGTAGLNQLNDQLKNAAGADSGFIALFTKHFTIWHGYAGGIRIMMRTNPVPDGFLNWTSIHRTMAHEAGHIFGAPDEYSARCTSCGSESIRGKFFRVRNGNCATCNNGSVNCVMKNNTIDQLCAFTPGHIGWEAFLEGIDGALYSHPNNRIYLFSGKWFTRTNPNNNWELDDGYPALIEDRWPGFPANFASGIDAALWNEPSKRIYFFKGNQFIRVNPADGWKVEPGYPKTIAGSWPGMPANFASGIDAAIWSHNTRIYIFKGNQFVRITPSQSWAVEPGYPRSIAGSWPGMPASFAAGIDSALWSETNQRIYFFKGSRYVRVNPAGGWAVEPGFPKFIDKNWRMPFPTTVEANTMQMLVTNQRLRNNILMRSIDSRVLGNLQPDL